ncbi:hypothetical protein [Thermoanaerobacter sp. A7A]|uniref:hypothetical protein n=1 Tax=Thermoanaerobacter sp. A7A TaxID=1350366 RepID=UPI0004283239|nr:hypothetical protein [Thermoanaerobacter sp. A7A]
MEYPKYFHSIDEIDKLNEEEKKRQFSNSNVDFTDPERLKKNRFFVRTGEEAEAVFLDDFHFAFWEHRFEKDGDRYNYETCLRDIEGECPLCDELQNRPYIAIASTVLSKWKDRDGNWRLSKKLIVAKGDAKDRLIRRQKSLGNLRGKKFLFIRSSSKTSNSVGTDIDYVKDVDLESLEQFCPEGVDFEEWLKPFDYAEIFKPKTVSELKSMLSVPNGVGEIDNTEEKVTVENIDEKIKELI